MTKPDSTDAAKPICNASYMGSYARTRFCAKPAGHDGEHDWADFYREDMKEKVTVTRVPDSTDAGGVTHGEARLVVRSCWNNQQTKDQLLKLTRYIDAQEAALATLTRERDSLLERLAAANAICRARLVALEKLRDTGQGPLTCHDCGELTFVGHACQPATPPAPLPGGQGPNYVTRAELFETLPAAMAAWGREGNAGFRSWLELYFAERGWPIAEQGGEGREG